MIRKFLLFLLICFVEASVAFAQKLKPEFSQSLSDITAQTEPRKDLNGKNCALVKVQFVGEILDVEGNVVKPLVRRSNETWVYMPQNSRQMKVVTKNYLPLMVTFADFGIERLESNGTYVLVLSKPDNVSEPVDAGGNFYALTVQPSNAVVTIDGIQQTVSSDGEYSAMLPYGSHSYKVEAGGYISQSGTFIVSSGEMQPISVRLVSAMATLSVSCSTPAVSLYVDKKSVGGTPWTGSLKEGMHLLEVKKDGYRSQQKTVNLAQQQKLDISFGELSAILGNLSVNYKPFGCDVYLDGKKIGQSPRVFNGIVVGNHRIEIKKDGYTSDNKTITVSEGQTASVSGTLASASSYANSSSSYSDSSSSSLSGGSTISIPVKNGISIDMIRVDAGTFMMGATSEMKDPYYDEKPVHQVTLTNDYYIGKYEVTQALWQAVMGSNPSSFKGDNLPVERVSWNDCQDFISKLNRLTGKRFRLPTEAEWEYAARGGRKSKGYQYSGSNNLSDVAWYYDNSGSSTHAVGTKQANELGIHDMTGNVWEWCQDWYSSYPSSSQTNPTGPASGSIRVSRGGSWYDNARICRSSYRNYSTPDYRGFNLGLRLVLFE